MLSALLGLVVLIADIWAIFGIIQSNASKGNKVLWIVLVFLLPVVGLILWLLFGPRGGKTV